MWLPILLTLAVIIASAYWFGYLSPAQSKTETPPQEDESKQEAKSEKKPAKKRYSRRTVPRAAPKEKRKLPTDPRFLRRFGGHSDTIIAMAISPNGEWMATTGKDGQVRVTQVEKGSDRYLNTMVEREGMFQDHLSSLAWSGDGRTLVGSINRCRDICLFRIRKKEGGGGAFPYELHELSKRRFSTSSKVDDTIRTCLVDQAHSNFLLVLTNTDSGRGNTAAWNGMTGASVGSLTTGEGGVRLSPEGRFLCGRGAGVAQVKIFEVLRKKAKGEVEPMFDSIKRVMALVPQKAKADDIALCRGDKCVVCCDDGSIQIWDLNVEYHLREDPKLMCTSSVLQGRKVVSVATSFLEDCNRIAVATADRVLHVLTYSSSSSTISLDFSIDYSHPEGISDIQFCPATGKVLYSKGSHSKDVFAWSVE